jgi:hypothetical protein
MRLYLRSTKLMISFLGVCLAFSMLTSLVGFQDIKKEGIAYKFRARIVDIEKPPPDQKVLVVSKLPTRMIKTKEKLEKIYVIVTSETIMNSGEKILKFADLRLEMAIEVEGLKAIDREDGKETTFVLAKKIRVLIQ